MDKKKKTLLKSAVFGLTAIATSLTIGLSAGCANGNGGSSSGKEDDKTTTKIDEQTIKNGNFEYYSDNKGLYPISNPDNWTRGSTGNSSASMSGVINTRKDRWDYITDISFSKTLEDNDDLESTDENKKDYNGALADDLPYKNTHTALDENADSAEVGDPKAYIDNPLTHKYSYNADGEIIDDDGNVVTTYSDEDGNVFFDSEFKEPVDTSVLMLHNYRRDDYYGAETFYTSSTTISLEANTAAEISLWVKTSDMYFGGSSKKEERENARIEFDRGAYIKVNTKVGGNDLDAFVIKNINTEQLNPAVTKTVDGEEVIDYANWENNGWVQYTVYVAASTFATTTVNLVLGLGEHEAGTVEGYAFFDDVTITKYVNTAAMEKATGYGDKIHEPDGDDQRDANVSYPLAPKAQNEFRVDVQKVQTNEPDFSGIKPEVYNYNFEDRHFLIDFANSAFKSSNTIALNTENVTAGLTVEDTNTGKFVCAEKTEDNTYKTNGLGGISDPNDKLYLPGGLRNNAINIKSDILATTTVGSEDGWAFNAIDTEYSDILTDGLKTATSLPGAGSTADALVMLSAYGAAYEAHITDDSFSLADGEYKLVSFWIKTSDMSGKTAATVTVKGLEGDDKDIKSSFTVDTTTLSKVTIGEGEEKDEDAYKGWARCFIRVSNTSKVKDTDKKFEIVVNFGNTSLSGTTKSSYKAGWLALTNLSVMELDEDVYGYTSGSSQTATIAFTETAEKNSHKFDTELGEKNEIKTDLAIPSSYTGVNGGSKFVAPEDNAVKLDSYHDANKNDFAGLLSSENFGNYEDRTWYKILSDIEEKNLASHNNNLWNAAFGYRTVQPLLIVNSERTFTDTETKTDESKIFNYGYIGKSQSVSANSYKAVSVRVKASSGAIASVYLVEDKSGGAPLTYVTPEYNFWYDADGNILKGEPDKDAKPAQQKENIAYKLRKDGLYENGDGKLYANFYNLTKQYDISFEHRDFYKKVGDNYVRVNYEDLVMGETYYADDQGVDYAPHYLVAGGKENNKVYLYSGEGTGSNATYYYVENGKANKSKLVYGVDTTGATAKMRYDNGVNSSTPYQFTIDTVANPDYANKWITVTFYVHSGSEAKNYKLELWSGKREEISSYAGTNSSYVVFDYSDLSASLDQTAYDGLVQQYTDNIVAEYKNAIFAGDPDAELDNNDANIAELEKKAGEKIGLYDYEAAYYTFSLYDSEAFIPFNGEINTEDTGYDFNYTESKESLAYLKVVDDNLPHGSSDAAETYNMSAFIDYSIIDKDVKIIGEPTASGSDSNDNDGNTNSGDRANVWLLASSIILVAAMIIAIAALFIKDFFKKHKGKKSSSKNSYNFNKNKRYVKKYVKANGEAPVIEEGEFDESLLSDEVKNETPAEKVDEPAPAVEETPAEEATPTEEEKPADDGKEE